MKSIAWFKEIKKEDVGIVGGKGANLGEMVNADFPVPLGFCITAQAYFKWLEDTGLKKIIIKKINSIDVENTEQLEQTTKEVRELIIKKDLSLDLKSEILKAYHTLSEKKIGWIGLTEYVYVAVRSSATAEDLPSIVEDSHVLVKINGKTIYDSIKNIYNLYGDCTNNEVEVIALENNEAKWIKAQQIYCHPAKEKKLYKIVTETGREITITKNHTLIVLDEDTLNPKTISIDELKNGQKVPVTKSIPFIDSNLKFIDVLEYIQDNDIFLEEDLVYIKNNSSNWTIQNPLKRHISINKNLAYFLGLYCAEGSTYLENGVIITNSDKNVIEKTKTFLRELELYNNQKINKHSIRVYCKTLVRLLHVIIGKPLNIKGKGKSAQIKKVPNFIFDCSKEIIGTFLSGCFDGDGYIGREAIEYTSISEMLIGGIVKLLELLNINFYIRKKKNTFTIYIPASQAEQFKNMINLNHSEKSKKLDNLITRYNKREKHAEFKNPFIVSPTLSKNLRNAFNETLEKRLGEIAKCIQCKNSVEKTSYYKNRLRYYCKHCKKTFYEKEIIKEEIDKYVYYDEKGRFKKYFTPWNKALIRGRLSSTRFEKFIKKNNLKDYVQFFNNSVLWDQVKEIQEIDYNGMVYDFTVPKIENFAAGLGGIITHNSASFAGQQDTYLNIIGDQKLLDAVKRCWASLFNARATYYRKKQGFRTEKVGISVVVQKMVNSEVAGVMFTSTPTGDETKIVIEAAYGLGEVVVSGSVTPDTYILDKESLQILSKKTSTQTWMTIRKSGASQKEDVNEKMQEKQKLEDKHIIELARIGKRIEAHYGHAQDIEWALENDRLYIVQSRAITTLGLGKKALEKETQKIETTAKPLIIGLAASPGIISGKVIIVPTVEDIQKVKTGDIIVTIMTDPDWVPIMRKASGIITNEGGSTCHAAIVSRELGIPCVVGTGNATDILRDNEEITLDGFTGRIFEGKIAISKPKEELEKKELIQEKEIKKIETALEKLDLKEIEKEEKESRKALDGRLEELKKEIKEHEEELLKLKEIEKESKEKAKEGLTELLAKRAIKVKVNVALPDAAEKAAKTNADGVGLLRAEHMITASGIHPANFIREGKKQELVKTVKEGIKKVAELFKEKPVWYRTFDARTDEFRHLKGGEKEPKEANPMLGWHGIRRALDEPEIIKAEFTAIKELVKEGFNNIGVMLPFVEAVEEVKKAKEIAKSIGLQPLKDVEFGVMIETPGAVWIIDELIEEGISFISFGTNDLTQLTLGLDRNNERIQKWFNSKHPAILRQCEYVIKKCLKAGVKTSICGQAGSDPEMVKKLIEYGITSVSANIDAVEKIKELVLEEEKKKILNKIDKEN